MCLAKSVPSQIRVRGCIAWSPVRFFSCFMDFVYQCGTTVVLVNIIVGIAVFWSMSLLGRTSMHIHDLNGDPK